MTIEWGTILTTLLTTIIVGGGTIITFVLFFQQRKKKENSDVVDKDASAASNMLEFATNYYNFTERIVKDYQDTINKKDELILENQRKLLQLEITVEEHSKKIKNLTNLLLGEQRRRSYAEKHICLINDCMLRKPEKGTFKALIEGDQSETTENVNE